LRIYSFESLPSTQKWLTERVAAEELPVPCAVIANHQTDGVGSRENRWIGEPGNFFASVAVSESLLPADLPLTAASIYFMFLMKETLKEMGSRSWLKWPNDLYLESRKIGGCITTKKRDALIAGIGVNIASAPRDFGVLDIRTTPMELLEAYLERLEKFPSWKQIFSIYRLEFDKSKRFRTHAEGETVDLREAVLQSDGSLTIGKRRVVSPR
jgi:BirA family biotin operon repressor/biotin-[acetyl-CoA-carboxylase] ligase